MLLDGLIASILLHLGQSIVYSCDQAAIALAESDAQRLRVIRDLRKNSYPGRVSRKPGRNRIDLHNCVHAATRQVGNSVGDPREGIDLNAAYLTGTAATVASRSWHSKRRRENVPAPLVRHLSMAGRYISLQHSQPGLALRLGCIVLVAYEAYSTFWLSFFWDQTLTKDIF
jgi:hypothetical protein